MKNVCVLSDNRTGWNWGARATSIALIELIKQHCNICGIIYNDLKLSNVVLYHKFLFIKIYFFVNRTDSKKAVLLEKCLFHLKLLKRVFWIGDDHKKNIQMYYKYNVKNRLLEFIDNQLENADCLVVNGEGDMIFSYERYTLRFLLTIMEIAHKKKIDILFLNSMVSESPSNDNREKNGALKELCIKILRYCSVIQLRENMSGQLLSRVAPDILYDIVPDALFTWGKELSTVSLKNSNIVLNHEMEILYGQYDFSMPYICISGSSLISTLDRIEVVNSFIKLVEALKKLKYPIYLIAPCTGDSFLKEVALESNVKYIPVNVSVLIGAKILANSILYISGRYHPSIMASLGGTPIICFTSNSHKMLGLQQLLQYEKLTHYELPLSDTSISEIVYKSAIYIQDKDMRTRIGRRVQKLNVCAYEKINKIFID